MKKPKRTFKELCYDCMDVEDGHARVTMWTTMSDGKVSGWTIELPKEHFTEIETAVDAAMAKIMANANHVFSRLGRDQVKAGMTDMLLRQYQDHLRNHGAEKEATAIVPIIADITQLACATVSSCETLLLRHPIASRNNPLTAEMLRKELPSHLKWTERVSSKPETDIPSIGMSGLV